jgi:hypothetical protein
MLVTIRATCYPYETDPASCGPGSFYRSTKDGAAKKAAAEADKATADAAATSAAVPHAKSLGFTDAMIAVMYPNLAP